MQTLKYSVGNSFEHPGFFEAWMYPDLESKTEPALKGLARDKKLAVALLMDEYSRWLRRKRLEEVLLNASVHCPEQA
jgi:hypothetical protein